MVTVRPHDIVISMQAGASEHGDPERACEGCGHREPFCCCERPPWLPDVYSLPSEGTPEQIRMAMGDVAMGLRRVDEDEARAMGRMGKP